MSEALAVERERGGLVRELYVTSGAAAGARVTALVREAFAVGVTVTEITERAAAALSDTKAPQGLVARCALLDTDPAAALARSPRLVAVLVEPSDPGNAGTVIRLADAAGADAVLLAGDAVDVFNPKVVRATTGSLFHLPIGVVDDPMLLPQMLAAAGLSTVATSGTAELELPRAEAQGLLDLPTAWLFGSEAHGLDEALLASADITVRIPIYGRAESLNLATAAAICLYASATAQHRGRG